MTRKKGMIRKVILGTAVSVVLFVIIAIISLAVFEKNGSIVSDGQKIKNYAEHNYALLVIDIQEATTGPVSKYPFYKGNSDVLINEINGIAESFKNQNATVIYVRSEISNPIINLINNSYAKGSSGARFDKRLKIVSDLEIIKAGKDPFRNTNLDSILIRHKISELYIVGLDAAECINATVQAAQNRNYRVNLIDEAILSKSSVMKDSMIINFKFRGVEIVSPDSLTLME